MTSFSIVHVGMALAGLLLVSSSGLMFVAASARMADVSHGGAWGAVTMTPITLVPSDTSQHESLPADAAWWFPATDQHTMADVLTKTELPADDKLKLLQRLVYEPDVDGFRIIAEPETVKKMPARARQRIYNTLGLSKLNRAQVNAYRFWGPSIHDWLEIGRLDAHTRKLLKGLIYRNGEFLFFADYGLIAPELSESQRMELHRTLAAERSLMMQLYIAEEEDVEPLVAYWGRGGRETEVRVKLESLARTPGGGNIDIVHLLPAFARTRLFTYPDPNEPVLPTGHSRDCHWTALNFFNDKPDDRLADAAYVGAKLASEFVPVDKPQFGDLVVFSSGGEIFHSAVYIAADVLFTRNGTRLTRPWMLLPIDAMTDFYPKPGRVDIQFLRRKSHQTNS